MPMTTGKALATHQSYAESKLGPAMRALNERQRQFVLALLEQGTTNYTRAAAAAGYGNNPESLKVQAHRLAHDPRILAALQEEAKARITAGVVMAASSLVQIAEDSNTPTRDRLRALEMIMNRGGLHAMTESKQTIVHEADEAGAIARIKTLAATLGLDAKALLGSAGVVDVEFVEITSEPVPALIPPVGSLSGLEDML